MSHEGGLFQYEVTGPCRSCRWRGQRGWRRRRCGGSGGRQAGTYSSLPIGGKREEREGLVEIAGESHAGLDDTREKYKKDTRKRM